MYLQEIAVIYHLEEQQDFYWKAKFIGPLMPSYMCIVRTLDWDSFTVRGAITTPNGGSLYPNEFWKGYIIYLHS